jgi:dihydrolipoamide dehydrogenase
MENQYDIIFIGSGPGGYTVAIRGAQLGYNIAIIEKYAVWAERAQMLDVYRKKLYLIAQNIFTRQKSNSRHTDRVER